MTCVHMFVHMVKHTHRRYSPIFSCVIIWIPFTWPEEQLKSTRSDRSEGLPWQQGSVMDTLQYWHSHIHTYTHSPSNLASTQQINFKNIKSVCEYIFNLLPQCTKQALKRSDIAGNTTAACQSHTYQLSLDYSGSYSVKGISDQRVHVHAHTHRHLGTIVNWY